MKAIETTIFVEPVAKGRARVAVIAGRARAYTPKKTVNAEADIKAAIRNQMVKEGHITGDSLLFESGIPLYLEAIFYRQKPKSTPKKVTMPVTKPDTDNYTKLLIDALNKFLFADDSQIVTLKLKKRFTDGTPCIYLKIREETE